MPRKLNTGLPSRSSSRGNEWSEDCDCSRLDFFPKVSYILVTGLEKITGKEYKFFLRAYYSCYIHSINSIDFIQHLGWWISKVDECPRVAVFVGVPVYITGVYNRYALLYVWDGLVCVCVYVKGKYRLGWLVCIISAEVCSHKLTIQEKWLHISGKDGHIRQGTQKRERAAAADVWTGFPAIALHVWCVYSEHHHGVSGRCLPLLSSLHDASQLMGNIL